MDEVEFDKFADEYRDMHAANIKLSGEDPEYFAEYKIADIAAELERGACRRADGARFRRRRRLFGAVLRAAPAGGARDVPRRLAQEPRFRRGAAWRRRRVPPFRRPADSVRRRHVRRRAGVVRVPPHPARRARRAARRDPPCARAGRPAVRVRAQSVEPADASRRQHVRVRRACEARAGADDAAPRARRRLRRRRRSLPHFLPACAFVACVRSKRSSSGCRSARSTTSRHGRRASVCARGSSPRHC